MSYRNIICDVIFFPLSLNPATMKTMISGMQIQFQNYFSNVGEASVPTPFLKWNGLFRSSAAEGASTQNTSTRN